MEHHFVENADKKFYFSHLKREEIEKYDDDLASAETIIFSYNDEDKDEPFKSLSKYLTKNLFYEKETLLRKMECYHPEALGVYSAIAEVVGDVIVDIETSKIILNELLEERQINKELYNELIKYLDANLKKQFKFIDSFSYTSLVSSIEKKRKGKQKEK